MEMMNGVSDMFGRIMSSKSGSSAHSTQHRKSIEKKETSVTRPYMAESCGGCDDHDAEIFGFQICGFVGGLN